MHSKSVKAEYEGSSMQADECRLVNAAAKMQALSMQSDSMKEATRTAAYMRCACDMSS
jgi:hypothetical protein